MMRDEWTEISHDGLELRIGQIFNLELVKISILLDYLLLTHGLRASKLKSIKSSRCIAPHLSSNQILVHNIFLNVPSAQYPSCELSLDPI